MAGLIEVIESGLATTVQDAGRAGYRRLGIATSGALDPLWLACANALVGNPADAAGLECRILGPSLKVVAGPVRIALASDSEARIESAEGVRAALPPWRSATLRTGDSLAVGAAARGVSYLAIAGGVEVPLRLGSRATYLQADLGGVEGRRLRPGDRIPAGAQAARETSERVQSAPGLHEGGPLRVMLGPQADHFSPEALEMFFGAEFVVTRDADRMGIRLDGPRLAHDPRFGAEIVSDGVTPGAIQVPADGRPIVLLADCQTVGGYPKIATVIRADLPRLAHLLPGDRLRFAPVDGAQARAALRAQAGHLARWISGIARFQADGGVEEALLHSANLVSGMVDALADPESAGHS